MPAKNKKIEEEKKTKKKVVKTVEKKVVKKPKKSPKKKDASKKEIIQKAAPKIKAKKGKSISTVEKKNISDKKEEQYFAKWTERDFVKSPEENLLYYVSAVLSFFVIAWSIKDGSWLSALTFFILFVVVVFEIKSGAKEIEYKISIDGIIIDDKLYRFADISSFEIVKKGEVDVVKMQIKNSIFPTRELYLEAGQDLLYMQALLEYFLTEKSHEDSLFNFKEDKKLTEDEFINQKVDEYLKGKF